MKLLLPVAGRSIRFPGLRPKWLITLPNGQLMIERSLSGLRLENINEIVVIMLSKHKKYINPNQIKDLISDIISSEIKINIFELDKQTISQPETIASYLKSSNEDFSFFVKDCDNYFEFTPKPDNVVSFVELSSLNLVAASAKSYISFNKFNEIELIAEKSVISDKFCCGGYGFKSSKNFLENYNFLGGGSNKDLYVSHIIQRGILSGDTFYAYEAKSYEDYGTFQEYSEYIKDVRSIFCDFDGVLVINSSKFASPPWQYKPNNDNLKSISNYLKKSPFSKLIITTSRPKNQKQNIINFLRSYEIECLDVITDLPHASRVLINDFSNSNPYPTSQAINLVRDSTNLEDYL